MLNIAQNQKENDLDHEGQKLLFPARDASWQKRRHNGTQPGQLLWQLHFWDPIHRLSFSPGPPFSGLAA